ncbi:methyl-accepting chemotaxis protein [Roseibium sp. RKSG952]|uniref:methyl-accepting chemotaxis protein n=1 Tax=Roseibium sp. RKSG952 TaxID=2529384 RepID=UPI0012BC8EB4|nr:methyl-accepting chemotaxis protein [Roseibium sp. RKSG952]MTH96788.1 methyl-accepting chemotaxis protein [Roseibium sp. RKSG952]
MLKTASSQKGLSISGKLMVMVAGLSLATALVAAVGIVQMQSIGEELTSIAEKDLPLTETVTQVTNHQLEQAILVERLLRLANINGTRHGETLTDVISRLKSLGAQVEQELREGEALARTTLARAANEEEATEFRSVLGQLTQIEQEYATYSGHIAEVVGRIEAGQTDEASALASGIEAEQEKLDTELIALTHELEQFTLSAAQKAKAHEEAALLQLIAISVAAFFLGLTISFLFSRYKIALPLRDLTHALKELASGNTGVTLSIISTDEIGQVAAAYETFRSNTLEMQRLQEQAREEERRTSEEKREATLRLADELERTVKTASDGIADVVNTLGEAASILAQNTRQTSQRSGTVAAAAEQASAAVQTVASASEQLAASIQEISRQVSAANTSSEITSQQAKASSTTIENLSTSTSEINNVLKLISDIASQTNLLALNATIEAARAGEAGKGFAVVASEVKALAEQTGGATDHIGAQIGAMKKDATLSSEAMLQVIKAISEIDSQIAGIASAVEQQNAVTSEIARNAAEVATGSREISQNISEVNSAAEQSSARLSEVLESIDTLSTHTSKMQSQLDDFLISIRAA